MCRRTASETKSERDRNTLFLARSSSSINHPGMDIETVSVALLFIGKGLLFAVAGREGFWYGGGRRERGVFRCRPPPEGAARPHFVLKHFPVSGSPGVHPPGGWLCHFHSWQYSPDLNRCEAQTRLGRYLNAHEQFGRKK